MIDYTSYKKIHTNGSLFTLTGADFTGYAQLKDGVATEVSTGKTLSPKSTYATDLFYTNYFQDRVIAFVDPFIESDDGFAVAVGNCLISRVVAFVS